MATRIVAPGGAPTHPQSAGQAPRAVYSPEQTRQALGYITAKADTLRTLLEYLAQDVEGNHHLQCHLQAAGALAEMIAASADTALGGECVGGFEEWIYGADFGKAGAA